MFTVKMFDNTMCRMYYQYDDDASKLSASLLPVLLASSTSRTTTPCSHFVAFGQAVGAATGMTRRSGDDEEQSGQEEEQSGDDDLAMVVADDDLAMVVADDDPAMVVAYDDLAIVVPDSAARLAAARIH